MDFQFWIYVIIGVIYLISRIMKKPANQTDFPEYGPEKPVRNEGKAERGEENEPLPRQLTFEELLREITQGKMPERQESEPVPAPKTPYYTREEKVVQEKDDLEDEDFNYRKDDTVKAYEEAKRQAFLRPSLEETMDIRNTEVTYARFKEFEQVGRRNLIQEYLGNLNDKEGWKKAIVMSEILQRKF